MIDYESKNFRLFSMMTEFCRTISIKREILIKKDADISLAVRRPIKKKSASLSLALSLSL